MLINLLTRDLRTLDGIQTVVRKKGTEESGKNVDAYVDFKCKIRFKWYASKSVTWRDLTGPEKNRLFQNIVLFPDLQTRVQLQKLWKEFFDLIKSLENLSADFDCRS